MVLVRAKFSRPAIPITSGTITIKRIRSYRSFGLMTMSLSAKVILRKNEVTNCECHKALHHFQVTSWSRNERRSKKKEVRCTR